MAKVRIPSTGYYFDWQTYTLYMTYRFSVKANDMTTDAYSIYERFSEKFPTMRVVVEKSPKRNPRYIPYDKMIQYMALMENGVELLAEFNQVRQASTAQTNPTQFVNQWFKETFPDYKKPAKKAS